MSVHVQKVACVWRTEESVSYLLSRFAWSSEAAYYLGAEIQTPVFMIIQQELLIMVLPI